MLTHSQIQHFHTQGYLVVPQPPPDHELAALNQAQDYLQWNAALYDDSCLIIVPASHTRIMTPEEKENLLNAPTAPMPNQITVHLQAGQTAYYNPNLLHR